jgi:hypothetical protein
VAASSGYDHSPDFCLATKTWFAIALINAMAQLEAAAIAFRVDVV